MSTDRSDRSEAVLYQCPVELQQLLVSRGNRFQSVGVARVEPLEDLSGAGRSLIAQVLTHLGLELPQTLLNARGGAERSR